MLTGAKSYQIDYKMSFSDFMDAELSHEYEHLVTLYAPGPKKPWEYASRAGCLWAALDETDSSNEKKYRARLKRFLRAQQLARHWVFEVKENGSSNFRYLMAIEDRKLCRDFNFHLALSGTDWDEWAFDEHFAPLWKQMSGGIAHHSKTDNDHIRRAFWKFVVDQHCFVEINEGDRFGAYFFAECEYPR